MKYRQIANADVSVSEVGFGVWTMATSCALKPSVCIHAAVFAKAVAPGGDR